MLGGHHHVFLTRGFGQLGPCTSSVRLRLKALRQQLVFAHRDAFFLHDPFMAAQYAIQSPVNEHAEARFMPPLHATNAIGVLRVRSGLRLCRWRSGLSKRSVSPGGSTEREECGASGEKQIPAWNPVRSHDWSLLGVALPFAGRPAEASRGMIGS